MINAIHQFTVVIFIKLMRCSAIITLLCGMHQGMAMTLITLPNRPPARLFFLIFIDEASFPLVYN